MSNVQWATFVGALVAVGIAVADAWHFHALGQWDDLLLAAGFAALGVSVAGPSVVRALRRQP